jgi:hypothetical protein
MPIGIESKITRVAEGATARATLAMTINASMAVVVHTQPTRRTTIGALSDERPMAKRRTAGMRPAMECETPRSVCRLGISGPTTARGGRKTRDEQSTAAQIGAYRWTARIWLDVTYE